MAQFISQGGGCLETTLTRSIILPIPYCRYTHPENSRGRKNEMSLVTWPRERRGPLRPRGRKLFSEGLSRIKQRKFRLAIRIASWMKEDSGNRKPNGTPSTCACVIAEMWLPKFSFSFSRCNEVWPRPNFLMYIRQHRYRNRLKLERNLLKGLVIFCRDTRDRVKEGLSG